MRPTILALVFALGACAETSPEVTASPADGDPADTAEVLATSEATVSAPATETLGEGVVLPAAVAAGSASSSSASAEATAVASLRPSVDVPEGPEARFTLRRGETLAHYARWSELPVEVIAAASELDLDGIYPVGTEVVVPIDDQGLAALTARRDRHHQARVDAYLAARGGSSGNLQVEVRTGDSAWTIAKEHEGIPVWLLESLNPGVDLEHLRPGQTLVVPRIGQGTVASADDAEESTNVDEDEVDLLADESESVEGGVEATFTEESAVEDDVPVEVRVLPELLRGEGE